MKNKLLKLLEPSPWQKWWDALPEHQRRYFKNQPVWNDRDLYYAIAIGFAMGLLVGLLIRL